MSRTLIWLYADAPVLNGVYAKCAKIRPAQHKPKVTRGQHITKNVSECVYTLV